MFETKTTLRIAVILLFLAGIACLGATQQTEYRRLLQISSTYETRLGSTVSNKYFYFRTDNPVLVDSVRETSSGTYGYWQKTYQYTNNIQYVDSGVRFEYYTEILAPPAPSDHVYFILDEQGRSVQTFTEQWNSPHQAYQGSRTMFRHYNEAGFADSLYYIDHVGTPYYTKRYFEGEMLQSTVSYRPEGGVWIPQSRFLFSYPENPVELAAPIRFDHLDNQIWIITSYDIEKFTNSKFIPQSIIAQNWSSYSASWVPDDYNVYSQTIVNNQIKLQISHSDEYTEQSDEYYIDMQGNLVKTIAFWNYGMDWGRGVNNFVWDSIVEINDAVAPELTSVLRAYPNPFSTELTIQLEPKENEAAEVSIYNFRGQLVRKWKDSKASELVWDGKDSSANPVCRGIYLIKTKQGKHISTAKVVRY